MNFRAMIRHGCRFEHRRKVAALRTMLYAQARMSRIFSMWLALILTLSSQSSWAQGDAPAEVKGVKIAVPMARGKSAWGTKHLSKALRRYIKAGTGTIISNKAFQKAQSKLGQKGARRYKTKNLAKAGRRAGADYVLNVKVTKKGWEFTAHAVLINTVNGQIDMDFRSGYFKPKVEGKDRGKRIGKTTLGKIAKLINEGKGPPPKVAAAPKEDRLSERMRDEPKPQIAEKPPSKTQTEKVAADPLNERLDEPQKTREPERKREREPPPPGKQEEEPKPDPLAERIGDEEEPTDPDGEPVQPRLADNIDTQERTVSVGLDPSEETEPATTKEKSEHLLHFRVSAGSNFVHTYKLSSAAVANSGLSYPLNAMSLFGSNIQFNVPGIPLSVMADVKFIPVRLKVSVDNSEVGSPSATLLDLLVGLNYAFPLTDDGISLAPGLGVRINNFSVDTHPGPIVLSSSSLAPVLLAKTLIPMMDTVDLSIGIEAGYVASYEETPTQSAAGGSKSGFDFGGDIGLYLWLSKSVAITVHLETVLQQVDLSGAPNRQIPPNENLQDPSVSVFDARGALGVELRL